MKRPKRWVWVVAAIAVVVLVWFVSRHRGEEGDGKPAFAAAERGPITEIVSTTGRVVPNRDVEIKCKASGEVVSLPHDVSDTVKKGDLLVKLDPINEQRRVSLAQIALSSSRARVKQRHTALATAEINLATSRRRAAAALASAKARSEDAKSKAARAKLLLQKELASREEYDTASTASVQAASELEDARARTEELKAEELGLETKRQDLVLAEAQVKSDEITLADANQRLRETMVYAPIDGVVSTRNVEIGQIVSSGINNVGGGTTLLTVADLSTIYVLASVDESDIGRVRAAQSASITVDAHPDRRFRGVVERIATKGTSSSNVVTFEVKIQVTDARRALLKPEMTANIDIVIARSGDALLVPSQAVTKTRKGYVVKVDEGQEAPATRTVEIGIRSETMIEVVSGLKEGERVVLGSGLAGSKWKSDRGGRRGPMLFGRRGRGSKGKR